MDVEDSLNNEPGNVNVYVNAVLFFTIVQFFDVLFLCSICDKFKIKMMIKIKINSILFFLLHKISIDLIIEYFLI